MAITITRLNLGNNPASYTQDTLKGSWTQTGSSFDDQDRVLATPYEKIYGGLLTGNLIFNATSTPGTYDMLMYRGTSEPLDAQTITGNVDIMAYVHESNTLLNATYHLHVYVTAGETDAVRGVLLDNFIDSTEWSSVGGTLGVSLALSSPQAMSSLAVSAGDRLVVEIGCRVSYVASLVANATFNYGTQNIGYSVADDIAAAGDTSYLSKSGYLEFSDGLLMLPIDALASQATTEVLGEGSEDIVVSSVPSEIVGEGTEDAIVSSNSTEVVGEGTEDIVFSTVSVEVLTPTANVAGVASQIVIEVLANDDIAPPAEVELITSQVVIEVLSRSHIGAPVEPIIVEYDPHEYTANLQLFQLIGNVDLFEHSASQIDYQLIGNVDEFEFDANHEGS